MSTFLLGVGAQKAGTSWLHRHLASSPQCDPGFLKEYHVFDALDLPEADGARERAEQEPRLAGFLADVETYFDHFAGLLAAPGIRLTCDITPAYAGLPVGRLTSIVRGFETRGVRPVSVFLLRDPVERIWSSIRMGVLRDPTRYGRSAEEQLRLVYAMPFHEDRTRYDRTLAALDASFGPERTFVGLYERLFEPSTLTALGDFLGIEPTPADPAARVNASPKHAELDPAVAGVVAEHYRPAYAAAMERFGRAEVLAAWPSARLLDPS